MNMERSCGARSRSAKLAAIRSLYDYLRKRDPTGLVTFNPATDISAPKKEKTLLTLPEKRLEEEARKKGKKLFDYDKEGVPIKARWEMVSLHTARRTFITNVYLSGKFSVEFMMKLSGHKKYDTFKKYVRLSLDEYADDIAKSAEHCLF